MSKERDEIVSELLEKYPIREQAEFNETNIHEKLSQNAELYWFYHDLWSSEKEDLEKLLDIKVRLTGKIYDELRFPCENSSNPDAQKKLDRREIEMYYIPRDPRMKKLNVLIARQRTRVEFFELCAKTLDKQGWNMKNFLDNEKLLK